MWKPLMWKLPTIQLPTYLLQFMNFELTGILMDLSAVHGNRRNSTLTSSTTTTSAPPPQDRSENLSDETDRLIPQSMSDLNSTFIELGIGCAGMMADLNEEQQKIVQSVQDFVDGRNDRIYANGQTYAHHPNGELSVVSEVNTPPSSTSFEMHMEVGGLPNSADGFCNRLTRIAALIRFVTNNEAQSTLGRHACNAANTLTRHAISVFIPTLLRQALGYAIENGLGQNHYVMRMVVGTCCAAYPILLNVAGLAREVATGTAERNKAAVRIVNIIVGTAALCAAAYTETLPEIAASLASFLAYCMMRDVVQMYVKLTDGTQEQIPPQVTSASACLYYFNQWGVGLGMQGLAAPSGQSAANLPYLDVIGHDVLRAFFNWIGESIDSVAFSGLQCRYEERNLAFKLEFKLATLEDWKNTLLGAHAGRTSLFEGLVLTTSQFNLPSIFEGTDTEGVKPALLCLSTAIDALLLALGYSLFVKTAGGDCAIL